MEKRRGYLKAYKENEKRRENVRKRREKVMRRKIKIKEDK